MAADSVWRAEKSIIGNGRKDWPLKNKSFLFGATLRGVAPFSFGGSIYPLHHQWEFYQDANSLFKDALRLYKPAVWLADIGCGIRPQNIFDAEVTIYVEPHPEYADWLEHHGFHPLVRKTAEEFLVKAPPLDCAVLFDVIEHMEKDEGKRVLELAKEKAKQVFVFTPHGFQPNHGNERADGLDAWGLHGVEMQRHKSGWTAEDFVGWQVLIDGDCLLAVWG